MAQPTQPPAFEARSSRDSGQISAPPAVRQLEHEVDEAVDLAAPAGEQLRSPPENNREANMADLTGTNDACAFCAFVLNRVKEQQTVYEDDEILVILDDYPIAHGHTLVILKDHCRDITCVPPEKAARLGANVARVAAALKGACNAALIYVASLGEQVQHVHYHLIPRYERDTKGFCHFMSPRGRLTNPEPVVARIKGELMLVLG